MLLSAVAGVALLVLYGVDPHHDAEKHVAESLGDHPILRVMQGAYVVLCAAAAYNMRAVVIAAIQSVRKALKTPKR